MFNKYLKTSLQRLWRRSLWPFAFGAFIAAMFFGDVRPIFIALSMVLGIVLWLILDVYRSWMADNHDD